MKLFKEFFEAIWEVFKLPFFLLGLGFMRMYHLGWRKLTMLIAAAIILTVVVFGLFFEISSQPVFCKSCHIMEPYIEAWEHSSHSDVNCMKCHAGTKIKGYFETKFTALSMLANYFTGLYKRSTPWAEIDDENCLQGGCHETRLLEGKIEYTTGITFDHKPHLSESRRGRKLRCTSCHSQIVQGEHISVTSSTCFLCHFKNVEELGRQHLSDCKTCHQVEKLTDDSTSVKQNHEYVIENNIECNLCHSHMWEGKGEVRRERCGSCHSEVDHINRIDDLEFIHKWHIEKRKVECQRCHDAITHKQQPLQEGVGNSCNTCHANPHETRIALYSGKGSRLVSDPMPDVMNQAGVICMSCHKSSENDQGMAVVNKDACVPCHAQNYFNLAVKWRKGFVSRIGRLEKSIKKVGNHPKLEDARHDLAFVKHGGAWHNPVYADAILDKVESIILHASGKSPVLQGIPDQSKECTTCHSAITEIQIQLPSSAFNHRNHIVNRQINCKNCHTGGSPEDRQHGRMLAVKQSCTNCHHKPDLDSCEPCHAPSSMVYMGKLPGMEEQQSPMAENEMECLDCHESENGYRPPNSEFCLDCHDQDVLDALEFTRAELLESLRKHQGEKTRAIQIIKLDKGRAVHNPDLVRKVLE